MKNTVFLLALISLMASCSKVEKAEKNMDKMKEKTEQMSSTTNDMKDTTTVMYQQIRSKEAEDTRNKKFAVLNDKEEGFGAKIAAASIYFKSFEFQLWSAQGGFDSAHARDVLLLDAVNEFTKRICDIYDELTLRKMSPTNSGKKHNDEMAFYALAATMHMNHHYQEELINSKKDVKGLSFYDIVKSALRKEHDFKAMKEHEEILVSGINKEIMIELVKARIDMLSALALKNLTDKRSMTLGQKLKAALFKLTGGKLGSIQLPETYKEANDATKKQTIKYLDAAMKAKTFLAEIEVKKELEKTLKSAFSEIKLDDIQTDEPNDQDGEDQGQDDGDVQEQQAPDQQKAEIKNLINGLLN